MRQIQEHNLQAPPLKAYCPGCEDYKWKTEFHTDLREANGLASRCKVCKRGSALRDDGQRVRDARRAAKRRNLKSTLTQAEWNQIVRSHGGQCACGCGQPYDELDHIIGLAFGGTNTADNVQPLAYSCHVEKTRKERRAISLANRLDIMLGGHAANPTALPVEVSNVSYTG